MVVHEAGGAHRLDRREHGCFGAQAIDVMGERVGSLAEDPHDRRHQPGYPCVVESSTQRPGRGRRALRLGAAVALALAAGFAVWLFVRSESNGSSPTTTQTPGARTSVRRATAETLATLSRVAHRPVYWAGPRPRTKLELTQTTEGRVYIRYLPLNVRIGDRRGSYLIVATYRVTNAYKATQTAANESGAHRLSLRGDAIGVYNDASPTNVYFALPKSDYQVEVYHPNPIRARALVMSGKIRPIR